MTHGEVITDREERELRVLALHEPISITWSRYAPGERGPDLHVHREHSDAFYVLEGELTFGLGPAGEEVRVPAGGFVAAPPNLAHSFANESGAVARFLNLHAPDTGFVGSLRARRDGGDPSYDQFDPPADGGRPRDDAIVSGPGEGERLVSGNRTALMKGVLDDMSLADWTIEGPFEGPELALDHVEGVHSALVPVERHARLHPAGSAPHLQPSRLRHGPLPQHPRARRGLRRLPKRHLGLTEASPVPPR